MSTITIGVDLAKSVFSVCVTDATGHVLRRQDLRREPFGLWLSQLPAGTVVAREACSSTDVVDKMDVQTMRRLIPEHRTFR